VVCVEENLLIYADVVEWSFPNLKNASNVNNKNNKKPGKLQIKIKKVIQHEEVTPSSPVQPIIELQNPNDCHEDILDAAIVKTPINALLLLDQKDKK
ncbi:13623_t:CDS:2, partial [Entrophospora sp. SA101]